MIKQFELGNPGKQPRSAPLTHLKAPTTTWLVLGTILLTVAIGEAATAVPLVSNADTWYFAKGTNPPQTDWKTIPDGSLNGTWSTGKGGFGYANSSVPTAETNNCQTILGDMYNKYTSLYIRKQFALTNPMETEQHLYLKLDWDDCFIAWLDGQYLTNYYVTGAPAEPAYNWPTSANHESSLGNSSPNPAVFFDLGHATNWLAPGTHTLAIMGVNGGASSSDFILVADLFLDTPPPPQTNVWAASNSPIILTTNVTVNSGEVLRIEPGVTVRLNPGVSITVNGQLLAEGTPEQRIRFARANAASGWSKISFGASSVTSRMAYCDIDGASSRGNITGLDTSLYLDHLVFTNANVQFVTVDDSSLILKNSILPTISGDELVHFWNMPANGHCLFEGNYFGGTTGYNDIIDLTGGNRPGPIAQFINNIFAGNASDEFLDLDGTDAHIEGNIFMREHQDGYHSGSSGNAISTGAEGSANSELTICRNIFFDIDHVLLIKDHGIDVFQNNTVVHVTPNPLNDWTNAVINFGEGNRGVPGGDGVFVEGNIFHDLGNNRFAVEFTNAVMFCDLQYNLLPTDEGVPGWPGVSNLVGYPVFVNYLTNNLTPENIRSSLALLLNSPALGTGPNGIDMGALVPSGASISGAPTAVTTESNLALRIAGPGIVAYKWRLNQGAWSAEIPLVNGTTFTRNYFNSTNGLVLLSNLASGTYTFEVLGKSSAGIWQGTNYGDSATATNIPTVRTWTISASPVDFTRQPEDGTILEGGTHTFTVEVTGSEPISYQWRKDGSDLPEATNQFLVITSATLAEAGRYSVIASNLLGAVPSREAVLLVGAYPAGIAVEPESVATAAGHSAGFSLTATGAAPIFCQWYKDSQPIAGATGPVYRLAAVGLANVGYYSAIVSNAVNAVTSSVVELTLTNLPVRIVNQPADWSGIQGSALQLTVTASGSSPQYQWFKDGIPIAQATSDSHTLATAQPADSGWYYVQVSNAANVLFSRTALVAVALAPAPLVTGSQSWRYDDSGANGGTAWSAPGFDDSTWLAGAAPLGFPMTIKLPSPTTLGTGLNRYVAGTSEQVLTYYFRTDFYFSNQLSGTTIQVSNLVDDGAVFYLNGREIQRVGMAGGPVTSLTLANRSVIDPLAQGWELFTVPAELLENGTNVLAVEVHQTSITSSDLALVSTWTANYTGPSTLSVTSQPASMACMEGQPAALAVGVSGGAGQYQWFKQIGTDWQPIVGATLARLTLAQTRPEDAGAYRVSVSNLVNQVVSETAVLTVTQAPPAIVSQPTDLVLSEGEPAEFSVAVLGSSPLSYQWHFNGNALTGATNDHYRIAAVTAGDAGTYTVMVTNLFGAATSSPVALRVTVPQPVIVAAPANVVTAPAASVRFAVAAEGYAPLSYTWRFNGAEINASTGPQLALTNVQVLQAGVYEVVVSNRFGVATSAPATLVVATPGEAINYPDASLVLDHTPAWFVQGISHDGVAALQSGARTGADKCDVRLTFTGPGKLTFWWRMEAADAVADLSFGLDGSDSHILRGMAPWRQETVYLTAGSHVAEWTFHLNNATGQPAGFLDEVSYLPGGQPPEITPGWADLEAVEGTNILLRTSVGGTPPWACQWQFNELDLAGATNVSLWLPDVQTNQAGKYTLKVSNAYGIATGTYVVAVMPSGPIFLPRRPAELTVPGGDATLRAEHVGTPPFSYQWRCEGTDLANATNATLEIHNASGADAGHYSLIVSNALGTAESPAIELVLSRISRVIHISVDGLGGKWLETALQNECQRYPNFARLQEEGAATFNARCDYFDSVTVPNHTTILTGRPVLQPAGQPPTVHHGYTDDGYPPPGTTLHNTGNLDIPYKASVFDVAHDNGLGTVLLTSKSKLVLYTDSYNEVNGAPDETAPDYGRRKIDLASTVDSSSVDVVNRLLALPDNWQYAFLHLADPDITGHALGWGTAAWYNTLEQVDGQLGRLLTAIETNANPALARETVIILTADHGGGGSAGVGGTSHSTPYRAVNFTIPFFAWGPGFPAGTDLYARFANRINPGTNYVDYDAADQPLRNGDSGNLALNLLGLPPIPGSTIIPVLRTTQPLLITWATPTDMTYGMLLGTGQLNASANAPGTFAYTPSAGTMLDAGQHTLTAVFTPTDAGLYPSATTTVQVAVNPAGQTITFDALDTKTYGDAPFALDAHASSGLAVEYASDNAAVARVSGNTVTLVGVGTAILTASQPGNSNFLAAAALPQTLTVKPATATVTLTNLAATYTGTAQAASAITDPAGLNLEVTYDGATNLPVNAGTYTVVASVTDARYAGSATNTFVIARAGQTITFDALDTKTYGDAPFTLDAQASSSLAVEYASDNAAVARVSGNTVTLVGVGTAILTASQPGNSNFLAAIALSQSLTVKPASATVTLTNLVASYTGTAQAASASTDPADLSLEVTYDGATNLPVNAGTYTVVASVTDARYAGSATNTLVIARAGQTITFDALDTKTYGDTPFTLDARASSGLAVDYASDNAAVAKVSGNTVTIEGVGTAILTASQPGNRNFLAAAALPQTLTVKPATATVTLTNLAATYTGTAQAASASTDPADLSLEVTYDGATNLPVNAGSYRVVATVTDARYAGSATNTLVIARAGQTITFAALASKTYGDVPFALDARASSGLAVEYASDNAAVARVSGNTVTIEGVGTAILTASQPGNSNFLAALALTRTLTVNGVAPVITASPQSVTNEGGATVSFTVTATGIPAPSFQWYKDGILLSDGNRISGSTSNVLAIISLRTNDAGNYVAVASNVTGVATSEIARLTVTLPPALEMRPALVTNGHFSFTARGELNSRYEVQASTDLRAWTTLGTLTNTTGSLSFFDPILAQEKRYYRLLRLPEL